MVFFMHASPARSLIVLALSLLGCAPASPPAPSVASATEAPAPAARPPEPPAVEAPAASAPGPQATASAAAPEPPRGPGLEELRAEARKDLGDKVSFDLVREHYLVVAAPGWGASGAKGSAQFIERTLKALFNERFSKGPARPLPVYLFGDAAAYNGYCRRRYGNDCISIYGFFSPSDYRLVMNVGLGIGTLSHELVHPIVDADFPDAPTWINEGIASLFEAPILPREGEIHGAKNWRYPRLSAALHTPKERDQVTLPALFSLSDDQFRDDNEDLHYAMGRYFCQWMDGQGKLWLFYRAWRDDFARDPRGEKAFFKVMGKTTEAASGDWLRWVRGL